jgi:hypothetical protein
MWRKEGLPSHNELGEGSGQAMTDISSNPHLWQVSTDQIDLQTLESLPRRLTKESPRLPYRRRRGEVKSLVHWGQRKLLISEIEFLSKYAPLSSPLTCIYCGAAPGTHIPFLSELFPLINFILIDPAPFHCQQSDRIVIRSELMTDNLARELSQSLRDPSGVLFISDIRSADWKVYGNQLLEQEIAGDMEDQMRWHDLLAPLASILKFRLPWTSGSTEYLQGEVYLPLWGPQTTTEARLVVEGGRSQRRQWDHQTHWEQMFYFNTVTRCSAYSHHLPLPLCDTSGDDARRQHRHCVDHCYDCAGEVLVLRRFLQRRRTQTTTTSGPPEEGEEEVLLSLIERISEACSRTSLSWPQALSGEASTIDEPQQKRPKRSSEREVDDLTSTCPTTSHTLDLLRACAAASSSSHYPERRRRRHMFWMAMAQPDMSDLPHDDRGERSLLGSLGCNIPPDCALDIWLWRLLESLWGDEETESPSLSSLDQLRFSAEERVRLFHSLFTGQLPQGRQATDPSPSLAALPVVALFTEGGVTYLFHEVPSDSSSATCSRIHLPPISWPPSLPGLSLSPSLPSTLPVLFSGRLLPSPTSSLWTLSLSRLLSYHGFYPPASLSLHSPSLREALGPVLQLSDLPWRRAITSLSGLREIILESPEGNDKVRQEDKDLDVR